MFRPVTLLVPALLAIPLHSSGAFPQTPRKGDAATRSAARICVTDSANAPIASAILSGAGLRAVTASDGCGTLAVPTGAAVTVGAPAFATVTQAVPSAGQTLTVMLRPAIASETVEVTSSRTPLPLDASASSVVTLSAQQIDSAPGFELDDRLRQVDGFQLFRRTSSTVANPTSQGTSLRGLGSTAASRTLVLNDQTPLNDAFGGWIHWNEIPDLAVTGVTLLRGGASDLYGSSAIGGVIDVGTLVPPQSSYALDLSGGSEGTTRQSGLLTGSAGNFTGLAASTLFQTDGYTLVAPELRGPVDTPSNVHSQNGRLEARYAYGADGDIFLRGNMLNESRNNGTSNQTNGTRLWRYLAGADFDTGPAGRLLVRLGGNRNTYRQTFSSIATDRSSDVLTRLQNVRTDQLNGVVQAALTAGHFTFVAGADVLDTRGVDDETPVHSGVPQPDTATAARQRDTGIYGEALWDPGRGWFAALSTRLDNFRTFDAQSVTSGELTPLPKTGENIFDPRLGLVKRISSAVSLNGSVFRAFRGPSLNELYRTGQVGQQTTKANPALRSERATGYELGGLLQAGSKASLRAEYFWTEVNRPVAAVALQTTATSQLLMRENLGQIRSRGTEIEGNYRATPELSLNAGYQLAISTVTAFQADPTLVGKWTPQVPRDTFTANLEWSRPRWGLYRADALTSGQQFDDSANMFELHGYSEFGLYGEHALLPWLRIYGSAQNLLDRRIEAGRTPVLTLGQPRALLIGIRLSGRDAATR